MKQVYLAGPITGLTFEGCTDWRDYAIASLADNAIKGLSPMRAKEFLKHLGPLPALKNSKEDYEYAQYGCLASSRGIMTRDRFDATRCDVLLVNLLGAERVSIGTVMEIAWADLRRTPIVAVMEEGNVHEHGMINEAIGFRVTTLDEALNIIKSILIN
jgi:nucleoside 2-deoxyribosyltransferase